MDVCYIHHSVLTFKIYIILCCHWRSISDVIIPFFLIKFIFRMIEMACLQADREELFWQCGLRCSCGALGFVFFFFLKPNLSSAVETQKEICVEVGSIVS